jgi:hypothetical protein
LQFRDLNYRTVDCLEEEERNKDDVYTSATIFYEIFYNCKPVKQWNLSKMSLLKPIPPITPNSKNSRKSNSGTKEETQQYRFFRKGVERVRHKSEDENLFQQQTSKFRVVVTDADSISTDNEYSESDFAVPPGPTQIKDFNKFIQLSKKYFKDGFAQVELEKWMTESPDKLRRFVREKIHEVLYFLLK